MRYILVDRFTRLVPGQSARAVKCVTRNDGTFADAVSFRPAWPPTLLLEGLAQVAGAVLGSDIGEGAVVILAKIEDASFPTDVVPGERIDYEVEACERTEETVRFQGRATVGDRRVAEASFFMARGTLAALRDDPGILEAWRGLLRMQGVVDLLDETRAQRLRKGS